MEDENWQHSMCRLARDGHQESSVVEMIVAVEEMEAVRNDSGHSKKAVQMTFLRFAVGLC